MRLKFDTQIAVAAGKGDNDLAMNLAQDQRDWYEYFGGGTDAEAIEYWNRKEGAVWPTT